VAVVDRVTGRYLAAVFELDEAGVRPLRARLAERLGLSHRAVAETVDRLATHGYVQLAADRGVELTESGRMVAVATVRRHRLAERLLTDVIGLSWAEAHHEAMQWEYVISDRVEAKLVELLDDPATCPHGNPIPGSANSSSDEAVVTLDQAPEGLFVVSRISEEIEADGDAMQLLADLRLTPGVEGEVQVLTSGGPVVRTANGPQTVPWDVAQGTYVTVGS